MASIVDILINVQGTRATKELRNFREELKSTGTIGDLVADSFRKLSLSGIAQGFSSLAGSITETTSELADVGNQLRTVAESSGQNIETIQGLQLAAERSSIPIGEVNNALIRLSRSVGENSDAFEKLGVNIRDQSGDLRSSEDILIDISDAFANLENANERAAVAQEIFGRGSRAIVDLISEGSTVFDDYNQELINYGAITEETLSQLDRFQEAQNEIANIQRQVAIETIDAAVAIQEFEAAWKVGLAESLSGATEFFDGLAGHWDTLFDTNFEYTEQLKEQADAKIAANEAEAQGAQEIQKTTEELEKERKELEKLIDTQLKDAESKEKQRLEREKLNRTIQNEIDLLRAEQSISETEARGLRRGVAERNIEAELEDLRRQGATTEQIDELRRLKTEELDRSLEDTSDKVRRSSDSIKEYNETIEENSETVERSSRRISESSKEAEGSLAGMLAGMDRISALAFEFQGAVGGISPTGASAFGTAGVANDPESLLRVADVARARALQDTIAEAQAGVIQIGDDVLRQYIEEFNQLSQNLGFGQRISETGRQGAFLGGETTINIQFNPNQDFDNLSIASQRQLAEQIAESVR